MQSRVLGRTVLSKRKAEDFDATTGEPTVYDATVGALMAMNPTRRRKFCPGRSVIIVKPKRGTMR